MANRLKDIFSTDPPEYESTVRFKDNDAYRNFRSALDTVENDGCIVSVDGVESVSLYMQDHGIRFPVEQHNDITHFFIGPAIESLSYSLNIGDREKTYNFKKYRITDGVVLETEKKSVVYLKMVFLQDRQSVRISYEIQYQHATSIDEITFELKACIAFLSKFCVPASTTAADSETNKINEVFRYLRYAEGFLSRLSAVENELGLTFSPQLLGDLPQAEQQEIEELYLLLCRKIPLRLNAKINATDITKFEAIDIQSEPVVGRKISLVFVRELVYDLLGQHFSVYTANAVINAIIKDFFKDGEKTTIYYGDTDTQPMYISYSAYLDEKEAAQEADRNIGGEPEYIEARTGIQYVKEYFDSI